MKKIVVLILLLMSSCTFIGGAVAAQADENFEVNADNSIEIVFYAESTGAVVIKSTKDSDQIQVKVNGDKQYEVWFAADEVAENKPDNFLEIDTILVGEHKINIKKDKGVYVVFVDGVMSAPYIGTNYENIDLSSVVVTGTGGVTVKSVTEGAVLDNEKNGMMSTTVNGELNLSRNKDNSTKVSIADKRYVNGSVGDGYGQIGARNRVVVTEGFDVTKPIVFYAKASHEVYGFGFGASKYDLKFAASTDTAPLGIQAFPVGGISYIMEPNHVGEFPNCAYRQGSSNTLDKFVIEIGKENTKITINDAVFYGVYENVRWKRADFPDGKAYLMFSFFSNGTTQGVTQELNVSLTEPISCEDSIKNYYMGEDTDIIWHFKQLQIDKVELKYGGEVLGRQDYAYDEDKQELTVKSDCLKKIFKGSDYSLKEIQVCDASDGFVYADLKVMLKRAVNAPPDNDFSNADITIKESGFFSNSENVFFVISVSLSVVLISVSVIVLYKKFWRKSK